MARNTGKADVGDDAILLEMKKVNGPFATAQELSERLGISRQRMNERLRKLRSQGVLNRKQCGSGYGWWIRQSPD